MPRPPSSRLTALLLLGALSSSAGGLWGCATGAPVGSSAAVRHARYKPFVRPSPARSVPGGADERRTLEVDADARARVVAAARSLVGEPRVQLGGRTWPSDCTGLVKALYAQVGVDLFADAEANDNGVTAIYRYAQRTGHVYRGGWPAAGDLVFFRETYDQNRDGRVNDGLTHVGVVESLRGDGTVTVIHKVDRGVVRTRMNLEHRHVRKDPATGQVLNDALRAPGGGRGERLTAELFEAYATLLPVAQAPVATR